MSKKIDVSKFKHKINLRVRYADLDTMLHVNNAAYLSYLEEGRISYFNDVLKIPKGSLNFGAVVARVEIDYLAPIELGDEVEILTRIDSFGEKSALVHNAVLVNKESEKIPAAFAATTLVFFDPKRKTTVPIPGSLKELINHFETNGG